MEEKKECIRETTEREFGDGNVYTILFTAGTALLMAGLKRALMTFFIEQWRLWVFLVLNLVLLAIFFTSMRSNSSENPQESENKVKIVKEERTERLTKQYEYQDNEKNEMVKMKTEKKRRNNKQNLRWSSEDEEARNEFNDLHCQLGNEDGEEEGIEDEIEPPRLSKEELNERVEAFIATFRQQLVSDARKNRDQYLYRRRESENFIHLQKRSNINLSSQGAKYLASQA